MSGALAVVDDMPDLLGTAPSDLVPNTDEYADPVTARRRAERIRAHLISYAQMRQDIADAFGCRDWIALGYSSWYAYLEGEFAQELHQLARSRDERQQAARDLRAGGLSTRQTARVLGVDAKTVRKDTEGTDAPDTVTGADGKTYPGHRHPRPAMATPAAATAGAPPASGPAGGESPAGPAADAIPGADAAPRTDRPGSPFDSPAGRDSESSPEGPAVATTGQPGDTPAPRADVTAEVRRTRITENVGLLSLALNNLVALAADAPAGEIPLFAIRQQRDDLDRLIRRLEHTKPEGS